MSKEVPWTKNIVEEFAEEAMLSDFENQVLRMHVKGMSRTEISFAMVCSISTVDRTIAMLKKKYDRVASYDVILPPRNKFHNMITK